MATLVTSSRVMRPTWVEVNLTALRHNYHTIQQYVAPNATVCCVVKADAYGHGAVECARALEAEGAMWFAVTSTEEGITLRKAGITGRILLLTGFWRGEEDDVLLNDLTPAVWDWWQIEALEDACVRLQKCAYDTIPVHLKLDTGMSRLGMKLQDLRNLLGALEQAEHVLLEGVFSHFASSEVIDAPSPDEQLSRFQDVVKMIHEAGLRPPYYHIANSAAVITRERSWFNMVRPGLSLYGYYLPITSVVTGHPDSSYELPVMPVLSWKTRIISIKEVPAHTPVGYNGAYVTPGPTRLAVLPIGYADGLSRALSSRGRVIVRDDYAAIVGNVAMDLTTIDITGIPGVRLGDEVTILGSTERRTITAWEHANLSGTIPYEVLCSIGRRVPRVYIED